MPLDICSTDDDFYADVVSVPPNFNGGEENVTINEPRCMVKASSHAIQSKSKQIPSVPCSKNDQKETEISSFGEPFVARKERRINDKKDTRSTTKRFDTLVIFTVAIFMLLTLSVGISFVFLRAEMRGKIEEIQVDLEFLKLNSKDGNVSTIWGNRTKLDGKFDQLKYRSDINMEQLSNITELLRIYQNDFMHITKDGTLSDMLGNLSTLDEKVEQLQFKTDISMGQLSNMTDMLSAYEDAFKYIKKALAIKEFSFQRSTLYRDIYMSSDNRTISTHRLINSTTGIVGGFQNYQGVRGTIQFSDFDTTYFEVSVHYKLRGPVARKDLVFEVGFSTEDTIDGHYYVGNQSESWSFFCAVNENGHLIQLFYQINGNALNPIQNLSLTIDNTSYYGLFGFYINGPKGEITAIDKQGNNVLHKMDRVDFTKRLFPVFGVYNPLRFNVTLTLNIGP